MLARARAHRPLPAAALLTVLLTTAVLATLTAYSTTPRCTALANGGPQPTDHVTLSWTVAANGTGRTVNVSASYATGRGTRTEVLTTYIEC